MEPKIVFEDESLLVIDKPSGMIVNRSETTTLCFTLQDWVEKNFDFLKQKGLDFKSSLGEDIFLKRSGIIHRLDKETSGLLIIAKTPEAFVNLQGQFKNRKIIKKYLALVHGEVVPQEGEINAPIGRLPWNRERFGIFPGGRQAVTFYKVISYSRLNLNFYTFLELFPQTGRTHQIRVHLKYLGHPIVGDNFYAGRKQAREDRKFCPRVFLHASFLEFTHPVNSQKIKINSPLPEELKKVMLLLWKM